MCFLFQFDAANMQYFQVEVLYIVCISRHPHTHTHTQRPCAAEAVHPDIRYTDASASWVLIASILVFFMVCYVCVSDFPVSLYKTFVIDFSTL